MSIDTRSTGTLTGRYVFDPPHTRLGFVARHAMVTKVRGAFQRFDADVFLDFDTPSNSRALVRIEAASIDTRMEPRDAHLRSSDFFDVEAYPELVFESTGVEPLSGDRYRLTGDLTIRDVTQPVTIDFEFTGIAVDPDGNLRAGFEGTATVNRRDWGLTWNAALETGGFLVSDRIVLEFDVSAIKVADPSEEGGE